MRPRPLRNKEQHQKRQNALKSHAEAPDGVGDQPLHVLNNRDVKGLDQVTVVPWAPLDLHQFGLPAAAQYDAGSLGVETTCGRGTDACTGTSQDDYLALKP